MLYLKLETGDLRDLKYAVYRIIVSGATVQYGRVSLKANQAVSQLTGMSDRAWRPIRK